MATKQKRNQPKPKPQGKKPAAKKAAPKAAKAPKKAAAKQSKPPAPKKAAAKQSKPPAPKKAAAKPAKKAAPPPPKAATAKAKPPAPSPARPASATPSSPRPSVALSKSTPPPFGASPTDGGVRYLTVQDLVELHRAVSAEFGGTAAHPGVVESQFGLVNAVQRPQVTTLGREAYPTFPEKVAAFIFALLTYSPFRGGNRRVALASLFAFCELNNRTVDSRVLDEKTAETLFKRAAAHREMGIPPENVYREMREVLNRAIVAA